MRYFPLPVLTAMLLCLGLNTGSKAGEPPSFFNGFEVENGLIATNEIDHGGPGRDGIPALDKPLFYEGDERGKNIEPGDQVLGVSYNEVHKDAVQAIDAINTWYGRGDLPIGTYSKRLPAPDSSVSHCRRR